MAATETIDLRASLIASGAGVDEGDPVLATFPEHTGPRRRITIQTVPYETQLLERAEEMPTPDLSAADPYARPVRSWILPGKLRVMIDEAPTVVDTSTYLDAHDLDVETYEGEE
jgi:hypothetical protein